MNPKLKTALRWGGYVAAYLAAFAMFFYFTFPYAQLKQRVISGYNASQTGASHGRLEIDELSWAWRFPGVVASGVRLIPAPTPVANESASAAAAPPQALEVSQLYARVSPLMLLFGTKQLSFSADAFGGEIDGQVSMSSALQKLSVDISDVSPGLLPPLAEAIGLPILGTLDGQIELMLPEGKTSQAQGDIEIKIENLEIGDGKAKIKNMLALPTVQVGTLTLKATATSGQLKIEELKADGPDLEVEAEGKVRLRDRAQMSTAELVLRFKFTDKYKAKNEVTKALFGDPKGGAPGVFDLDPTIKRAKQPDGSYTWNVGGTLDKLRFTPSSQRLGSQSANPKSHKSELRATPTLNAVQARRRRAASGAKDAGK